MREIANGGVGQHDSVVGIWEEKFGWPNLMGVGHRRDLK